MSSFLARIARALTAHWKRSLAFALLTVFVLGGIAGSVGGMPADDFEIPGTESQQATDLFRAHAPALAGVDATLVFSVRDGTLTSAENRAAIERTLTEVRGLHGVAEVGDPFGQISRDETIASTDVRYDLGFDEVEPENGRELERTVDEALQGSDVNVEMRGVVVDLASEQEVPVGELIGVAIAIVLLTLLFRSGAAMAATLVGALLGVMFGQIVLQIVAKPLGLPEFATTIAVMLGLGAGIDYALLIIGRYREQVAAGDSPERASAKAAATAGASVVAAGLIVMVAIAGLLVIGIPLIGKLGVGSAIGIASVVVSSLTILPIMVGALKKRLRPKKAEHVLPSKAFSRWAEIITARPWLSIVLGGLVLLALAIPVTSMRLGQPDDGNQPTSKTQRKAYDQLATAFGPGSNGPFFIAVDLQRGTDQRAELTRLEEALRGTDGVAAVMPAAPSRDGEMATIFLIPRTAPQDERTDELVDTLREDVIPGAIAGSDLEVFVGGATPGFKDFSAKVSSRLPVFIAVVIGLSVLLLMAAFRSIWVPLVSAAFNLLSIGAAYGIITLVFQQGWGASLIGADSGVPIVSFIPVMLFAILFGLSMDYNVFLLSRVREAYHEGDGPRESVVHGVSRIGKVILFAGLIMASVFLAFVSQPDVIAKMMGLGLGLAILIDVLVVRLVIAPAVVQLLGDKAWWMPDWLDKVIPNISLDGHEVDAGTEAELEAKIAREAEKEKVG
ncbi:MMPL family transporter [Conexibacter arvalis]|uniref:RND superfamily putative drug exporter n=1 Tax=Conexibacter arvalis TaxID=912552 RepID=A0A840IAD3_9ACTN|nr:MMPL family transporter [Conexibacter arvalis]MBB4661877.1 RND superfamily putative drug exporter [Conexibacter arvalis]